MSIGLALMTKTPGGSETNDSMQDLTSISCEEKCMVRRESGISLASGIYEEISDVPPKSENFAYINHIYENPVDLILKEQDCKLFKPPPLPPRQHDLISFW